MAFLRRNAVKSREEIDATNSPVRPPTAYEVISSKWNDPSFNPQTITSHSHPDFANPIDLSFIHVSGLIPAEAVTTQNRLSTIRVTLLRIIDRWEQSGQGDGGRHAEAVSEIPGAWGSLEGRSQEALDNRANFLGGSPTWYLYFWEMADRYQLLDSTLQRFSEAIGAVDANASTSVSRERPVPRNIRMGSDPGQEPSEVSSSPHQIQAVILNLLESQSQDREQERELHDKGQLQQRELYLKRRIDALSDTTDNYRIQHELTGKSVYEALISKKETEIARLKEELEEVEKTKHARFN